VNGWSAEEAIEEMEWKVDAATARLTALEKREADLSQRLGRLQESTITLVGWLTQVPGCFGQQDYDAFKRLLASSALGGSNQETDNE
jgi:hypothetical protein